MKMLRLSCALCCALSPLLASCNKGDADQPKAAPPPVPVTIAKAEQRDVPVELRAVGNVESISSITLRPQVSGIVKEVPAGEGRDVGVGDVVVILDSRPFEAALHEAEAQLVKDQALAVDQRRNAQALRAAAQGRAVSAREAEQSEAQAAAAEAQAGVDQASIETAKLNLAYCTITAPFAGRLGALSVKVGTVVKVNETDLITLTAINPIDISFSVREQDLASVRAAGISGPIMARALIPSEATGIPGEVNFIDSRVDPATGTVRMKARFNNEPIRLWPGAFVNVVITTSVDKQAVVVPSEAVQASQKGQSVFVVKDDSTVEMRTVRVSRAFGSSSIITAGVAAGETVVVDGQLRLGPGAKVAAKEAKPAATTARGTSDHAEPSIAVKPAEAGK